MTEWHHITAKFTSEEKRILDILRDTYGMNHNQSLKTGVEMLGRIIAAGEMYTMSDSKILKKILRVIKKHNRLMNADIKKTLKEFSKEQHDAEYEKISSDKDKIFSQFDNVFVKNRKRGRKKLTRKRGRSSSRL